MLNRHKFLILLMLLGTTVGNAQTIPPAPSAPESKVYIQSPVDGEETGETILVRFGLEGMGIAPAGVDHPNTGHHHLLIDVAEMPSLDLPLPATDNILHFGKGQTEATINLSPGEHTLQLVLGDYLHRPHDPALISTAITITVVGSEAAAQD